METQTLAELKKATAIKLAVTSKGYKATVKGATPDEALGKAQEAHAKMMALYESKTAPAEVGRSDRPVLVLGVDGGYTLEHGGGEATPFDPSQNLSEEYAVKIDLEKNSKGMGWDVTVKAPSVEAGVAMIEYTELRLGQMFGSGE